MAEKQQQQQFAMMTAARRAQTRGELMGTKHQHQQLQYLYQQKLPLHSFLEARHRIMHHTSTTTSMGMSMGRHFDDLPIAEYNDLTYANYPYNSNSNAGIHSTASTSTATATAFEQACRYGPLSTLESMLSSPQARYTPAFLHHGLVITLRAGNVEIARRLLCAGAPILRNTPGEILSAPSPAAASATIDSDVNSNGNGNGNVDQQIALFELLTRYGWTPNTPGYYGAVLLPRIVTTTKPLVRWFLAHGADPNRGAQRDNRDRWGLSDMESCDALERAAEHADLETVRMLLDAGARVRNGAPLHRAAGARPPGVLPFDVGREPTRDFDMSKIPIMELLVEHGADVNQAEELRNGNVVPQYAIVYAVMAGAVERVRWLLKHGADPEKRSYWGSAVDIARRLGCEGMKNIVEEWVRYSQSLRGS